MFSRYNLESWHGGEQTAISEAARVGRRYRDRLGPAIVAVGSGKGSTGKSFIVANLAVELAKIGLRVGVVDLDCEKANQHAFFGVHRSERGLYDYFGGVGKIEDCSVSVRDKIVLYSAGHRLLTTNESNAQVRLDFMNALHLLEHDLILVDMGSGSPLSTVDLWLAAGAGILVETPEPAALENAKTLLHVIASRKLQLYMRQEEVAEEHAEILLSLQMEGESGNPVYQLRRRAAFGDAWARAALRGLEDTQIGLVLNQLRHSSEVGAIAGAIQAGRFNFGFEMEVLGALGHSGRVWKATRGQQLVCEWAPDASISRAVRTLAKALSIRFRRDSVPLSQWLLDYGTEVVKSG